MHPGVVGEPFPLPRPLAGMAGTGILAGPSGTSGGLPSGLSRFTDAGTNGELGRLEAEGPRGRAWAMPADGPGGGSGDGATASGGAALHLSDGLRSVTCRSASGPSSDHIIKSAKDPNPASANAEEGDAALLSPFLLFSSADKACGEPTEIPGGLQGDFSLASAGQAGQVAGGARTVGEAISGAGAADTSSATIGPGASMLDSSTSLLKWGMLSIFTTGSPRFGS